MCVYKVSYAALSMTRSVIVYVVGEFKSETVFFSFCSHARAPVFQKLVLFNKIKKGHLTGFMFFLYDRRLCRQEAEGINKTKHCINP